MVGVNDRFGESGTPADLMSNMGLTSKDIQNAAHAAIRRK
jgi:transketolase C-terminal domain/subunit